MIGFAMIAKRRNHINISVLEEILKGRNKKWLIIVQQLISLVIFTIMFIISFRLIKLAGSQLTTNMRLPKRWVYWIYPPAFSVFVFQTFIGILQGIQDVKMTSEVQA
jgi:TRAP-type C4-dicarboxylate transport system permease small subunit